MLVRMGAALAIHPAGIAVDVVLLLPDRHAMFHFVDDEAAGAKRLVAMRGADADPHGHVADRQRRRCDARRRRASRRISSHGLRDDALAFLLRELCERLVFQPRDGVAFVVIAHPAFERGVAAARRVAQLAPQRRGVERRVLKRNGVSSSAATGGMNTTASPSCSGCDQSPNSAFDRDAQHARRGSVNGYRAGELRIQLARRARRACRASRRCGRPARAAARSTARGSCVVVGIRAQGCHGRADTPPRVFTLSSARGFGLVEQLRVGIDQEFARAVPAARDVRGDGRARARLPDGAQRFGQPVVAGAVRRRDARRHRAARSACRASRHRGTAGRRPAPARRRPGCSASARDDAGDRAFDVAAIHDAAACRARDRIAGLVGAHRDERARHAVVEQLHRRFELRAGRGIRAPPCRAACACCGRRRAPVHRAALSGCCVIAAAPSRA